MTDLPVPKAEAKPSTSDPVPEAVVDAAREAYERTECMSGCCGDIDTAIKIAFAAGRAQAAADIRAAVARVGELPAGVERSVEGQLAVVLLGEWENAAKVAEGGGVADQKEQA